MYSWRVRPPALILALAVSDHFILLHCQQPTSPPIDSSTSDGLTGGGAIVIVFVILILCCCWRCRSRYRHWRRRLQPPEEPIREVNVGNPLLVNNQRSQSRTHPSAPTVPSQAQQELSNQTADSGNPLLVNNPQSQICGRAPSTPKVHSPKEFKYGELYLATEGFPRSNLLGRGGFGNVYKGVLPQGQMVAIKMLNSGATQGMEEFLTEVEFISRAHHKHVVSLVGYFIDKVEAHPERPVMLVYEFMTNKSLYFHLHEEGSKTMDWETRMKIAKGSAEGLAYLHEFCNPRIIHRDIKSSNILLDDDFQPKIADFGFARLLPAHVTHVTISRASGTFGYLAPEYRDGRKMSEKSDVFAFGVVLLEMITGLRSSELTDGLVNWARPKLFAALKSEERNFKDFADPRLKDNYDSNKMFRMVSCAANCVRDSAKHRPTIREVVDALEGKICLDTGNEVITQVDKKGGVDATEHIEPGSSSHQNVDRTCNTV